MQQPQFPKGAYKTSPTDKAARTGYAVSKTKKIATWKDNKGANLKNKQGY